MNAPASASQARVVLAAIGAIAFVVACGSHEAIGHGGACLASGGRVLLLTSVFFRCEPSPWFVDAAGPAMNLLVALAAFAVLARRRRASSPWHLLLVFVFAFNGGWAAGYAVYSAASLQGDFAFLVRDGSVPLRAALAVAGVLAYLTIARAGARRIPAGTPVPVACIAAIVLGCVAAAGFAAAPAAAVREGTLEGIGATLGLLLATRRASPRPAAAAPALAGSWRWPLAAALLAVAFVGVLGRGIGDAGAIAPDAGERR